MLLNDLLLPLQPDHPLDPANLHLSLTSVPSVEPGKVKSRVITELINVRKASHRKNGVSTRYKYFCLNVDISMDTEKGNSAQ